MSAPVGPYTPIIEAGEWLICSGQIGVTGAPPQLVSADFAEQVRQTFANLQGLLETKGASLSDVVKTTVFLVDMADYALMNELYTECFGETRPARSAVAVAALPLGARFELEAWARKTD